MDIKKHKLVSTELPERLQNIPDPPQSLFVLGELEALLHRPCLAVVGSRKASPYGQQVTEQLVSELARVGVVIISGLAFGIDSIAHRAALQAHGQTIAVLPSGLDSIYPRSHQQLAEQIVREGGALVTEYPEGSDARREHFIARNRLVAGLSNALLVSEAAIKSGTLHTVGFALDQGKTVMAIPGNITSWLSGGTNNLIKTGAIPVTSAEDIFEAMHLTPQQLSIKEVIADSREEQLVLDLLKQGVTDSAAILEQSHLDTAVFQQTLTLLEISGKVRPTGGNHWSLS